LKNNEQSETKSVDFKIIKNVEPDGAVNDVSFNPRDQEVRLTGLSKSKIGLAGLFQSKIGRPFKI
jgi:hypothetical protein